MISIAHPTLGIEEEEDVLRVLRSVHMHAAK